MFGKIEGVPRLLSLHLHHDHVAVMFSYFLSHSYIVLSATTVVFVVAYLRTDEIMAMIRNIFKQSVLIPAAPITEKNVPDQTGRVHIITGGYSGCGLGLAKILYGANATVYIAGRDQAKADAALSEITKAHPQSRGKAAFLRLDLSDLASISGAVQDFTSRESRLDVLTNNAGVMFPKKGSKSAQGHDLTIGTNCLGPFLFTNLLYPILTKTAKLNDSAPGSVRVTWAASIAVEWLSPSGGGMTLTPSGEPKILGIDKDYGQSKVGNIFLATEHARRHGSDVINVAWNPGNLKTPLYRTVPSAGMLVMGSMLHPMIQGSYTELYAAVAPAITPEKNGAYIIPWGRIGNYRADIMKATKGSKQGGTGMASRFYDWCEQETATFGGAVVNEARL